MGTEQESDRRSREVAHLLVLLRPKLAEWRRLQQKNLNTLGLLKRKEWHQYHRKRESNCQVRRRHLCQKEKEQSHQFKALDHKMGESPGE